MKYLKYDKEFTICSYDQKSTKKGIDISFQS